MNKPGNQLCEKTSICMLHITLDTCLFACLDTYLIAGLVTGLDTCLVAELVEATFPVDE